MLNEDQLGALSGPISITVGTRSANLRPHFVRGWGVSYDRTKNEFTVFVPKVTSSLVIKDIEDNKMIAVTCADATNFLSRQFKGKVTEVRDAVQSEYEIIRNIKEAFVNVIGQFFGESAGVGLNKHIVNPAIAVRFKVEQIFNQTPGKNAGDQL